MFGTPLDEGFVPEPGVFDGAVVGVFDLLEPCWEGVRAGVEVGGFSCVENGDTDFSDFGLVVLEGFAVDADEDGVLDWGGGSFG